jgi:hypothetical protein
MRLLVYLTLLIILFPHPVNAERSTSPHLQSDAGSDDNIEAPSAGQAVQGSVVIRGNTVSDGFQSFEVDFSYSNDPTNTWFLIQESTTPVQDDILAVWDTTTITDGEYSLRLLVAMINGTMNEVVISGVRVRNYSPIETETPNPIQPLVTHAPGEPVGSSAPLSTLAPTLTAFPSTPTPLPTNPAEISSSQMIFTLGKGAGITIGIFAVLGVYLGLRAMLKPRK